MTSLAQLKTIHTLRRQVEGLDDDAYRGLLQNKFRVVSSKDLTDMQARALIDDLKRRAGQTNPRVAANIAMGRYAAPLQALWIAAYNLGLAYSKDDKALLKFVQRQTRVTHTRFLTDPRLAAKAIEGLKAWIARDGGVIWPDEGLSDQLAVKREVCRAIAAKLVACGGFSPFIAGETGWPVDFEKYGSARGKPAAFAYYSPADWDDLANQLGIRLRSALKKEAPHAK